MTFNTIVSADCECQICTISHKNHIKQTVIVLEVISGYYDWLWTTWISTDIDEVEWGEPPVYITPVGAPHRVSCSDKLSVVRERPKRFTSWTLIRYQLLFKPQPCFSIVYRSWYPVWSVYPLRISMFFCSTQTTCMPVSNLQIGIWGCAETTLRQPAMAVLPDWRQRWKTARR